MRIVNGFSLSLTTAVANKEELNLHILNHTGVGLFQKSFDIDDSWPYTRSGAIRREERRGDLTDAAILILRPARAFFFRIQPSKFPWNKTSYLGSLERTF